MLALKVVAEGYVTSFRYHDFMWEKQPTYEMPPPATIYGHICSAVGDWIDPSGVRFAYHFTYRAKFEDLEHIWTWDDKLKRETSKPFRRELLFQPRLILYLNRPDLEQAFRSPVYPVVLGRSQDLFSYVSVETVTLAQVDSAYFEHTLLPYNVNRHTSAGYAITLPRYLDYERSRTPDFGRYFVVKDRIDTRTDFMWFGERPIQHYWIDPTSPEVRGVQLGLQFLSFVGDEDEFASVA